MSPRFTIKQKARAAGFALDLSQGGPDGADDDFTGY